MLISLHSKGYYYEYCRECYSFHLYEGCKSNANYCMHLGGLIVSIFLEAGEQCKVISPKFLLNVPDSLKKNLQKTWKSLAKFNVIFPNIRSFLTSYMKSWFCNFWVKECWEGWVCWCITLNVDRDPQDLFLANFEH